MRPERSQITLAKGGECLTALPCAQANAELIKKYDAHANLVIDCTKWAVSERANVFGEAVPQQEAHQQPYSSSFQCSVN